MYMIKFLRMPNGWTVHVTDTKPTINANAFAYPSQMTYPVVVLDGVFEFGWIYSGPDPKDDRNRRTIKLPRNWLFMGASCG